MRQTRNIGELERIARLLRRHVVTMVGINQKGHIGGLAGLITWIFKGDGIAMQCVGVQDRFGQSALTYAELQEEYGLSAAHIAAAARRSGN